MGDAPPFEQVGRGFSGQFYNCLANNRAELAGIYRPNTLVTWCGTQLMGLDQIMNKMMNLGFNKSQWKADEVDCQPMGNGGVIVVIQGQVRIEGEEHTLRFNDCMVLQNDQQGWHMQNQVFRILGGE